MVYRNSLLVAVGAELRRRREQAGLTQRQLAARSGMSLRFLANLEGGTGNVSVLRLERVAHTLGTSAGELLMAARPAKKLIALVGLRGAGKSTIGKAVADKLAVPFVELDALVEREAGLSLGAIFSLHGESYYRRLAREVLTRFLDGTNAAVIATGGGIVMDREAWRLLQKRCTTIWLQASPDDHWKRVLEQGDVRPGAASPHAQEELRGLLKAREPLYAQAAVAVDTSRLGVAGSVEEIAARVAV